MGTWIEIPLPRDTYARRDTVVPYVGTWIEIPGMYASASAPRRRSLRGNVDRNCVFHDDLTIVVSVVPYVGTWIEIDKSWQGNE